MRNLLLTLFIFLSFTAGAQSQQKKFTNAIYIGAGKNDIIEEVIQKAKDYYDYDVDGIIKQVQKKKKIKLQNLDTKMEFLEEMEFYLSEKLEASDQWGFELKAAIEKEYLIDIMTLIGSYFNFGLVGKPNSGNNGKLYVTLGFANSKLYSIYATMTTIKDNHIDNGYRYTDAMLASMSNSIANRFGTYKHARTISSSNMCDAYKTEPVYYERFNVNDGKVTGYIEAMFGPYVYRINKNSCQYKGNLLTEISFWFNAL